MRRFYFLTMLCAAIGLFAVACEEINSELDKPKPVVTIETAIYEAAAEGETITVNYAVANGVEDAKLSVATEAAWVTDIVVAEASFSFTVAPNDSTERREATLKVSYPEAVDVEVSLSQKAKEVAPGEKPVINLSTNSMEASAEGVALTVNYTVTNSVEGAELTVTTEAEWIEVMVVREDNFVFSVDANEAEERREATLKVSYPGADDVQLKVSQGVKEDNPDSDAPFAITVLSTTELSFTYSVVPKDKEMEYIVLYDTAENFEKNNVVTGEDILAFDMKTFESEAKVFETTVEQLVKDYYIVKGDMPEVEVIGIPPGDGFVIYAYGVKIEGGKPVATTEVVTKRGNTIEAPAPTEVAVELDVMLDRCNATVMCDPGTYTGRYCMFVEEVASNADGTTPSAEDIAATASEVWYNSLCSYQRYGFATNVILADLTVSGEHHATYPLDADTEYYVAVIPVAETGLIYGVPTVKTFKTPVIEDSVNDIKLDVYDVSSRTATVSVTTTNSDPYVLTLLATKGTENMSDQEIMDFFIDYSMNVFKDVQTISGNFSYEWTGLDPNTEYMVIAFGYEGGTITTDLIRKDFTTLEEKDGAIDISVKIIGHFDTKEVAELNSQYKDFTNYDTFFAFEIITNPHIDMVYRMAIKADQLANMSDEAIKEYLLKGRNPQPYKGVSYSSYGYDYMVVAVAVGDDGSISELAKSEIYTISYETRGDAQDFLDYTQSSSSSKPASVELEMKPVAKAKSEGVRVYPVEM